MTASPESIHLYWQSFLATLPADSPYRHVPYDADSWGDSPALADELGELIANGTKTATCSALWVYEVKGKPVPRAGIVTIVLDGRGEPLCIVETTEVTIRPFSDVDPSFAYDEGEGNRSLDYWRAAHWRYFARTLPAIGREPTEDMPLVCERFRLIFPPPFR